MSIQLARPEWLILLALVPLWLLWVRPRRTSGLLFASAGSVRLRGSRLWAVVDALPRALRAAALACLIVALAHPRLMRAYEEPVEGGTGIVVAVDLSTSMWADDMEGSATRLEAARAAARRFVAGRDDAIGLVTFAGEALTRLPLTRDPYLVDHAIDGMEVGLLIDGTDIAGAIAAGSALLDAAPHDSKVLVLVTDGAHNRDGLVPAMAARAAAPWACASNRSRSAGPTRPTRLPERAAPVPRPGASAWRPCSPRRRASPEGATSRRRMWLRSTRSTRRSTASRPPRRRRGSPPRWCPSASGW